MAEAENYLMPESQRTRRLSSMSATRADLFSGPTVVVPPKHLMAKSDAFETAQSIELAKRHLDESTSSSEEATPASGSPVLKAVPTQGTASTITDRYAFAFDIDGVLIRGGNVIPEAIEAMKVLNGENEFGIKVYAFPSRWRHGFLLTIVDHTSLSPTVAAKPRKSAASTLAANSNSKYLPVNLSVVIRLCAKWPKNTTLSWWLAA